LGTREREKDCIIIKTIKIRAKEKMTVIKGKKLIE
jgi:hypothetical protein